MSTNKKLSRRNMLKLAGLTSAGAALAACAPQTVVVTQEVEKVVEKEKVVEVTAAAPTGPTNALGVTLPADALPLEQQYIKAPIGGTGGGFGHIMESLYNRAFEHAGGAETLTSLDINLETVPIACESWSVSEDGLSWDFALRRDLVFSDGTPITAHDWVYTLRWSLARGYDFGWFYTDIKNATEVMNGSVPPEELGIEAVDDYTLRITTKAYTPYLPGLGTWFEVARKDIWETAGENWALDPARYVSSGPFKLTEFNRGVSHKWTLNETYKGIRRPYMTEIREQPLPVGIAAYIAGDIQTYSIDGNTPPAEVALINANPVLRAESHPQPSNYTDYLGFNTMPGAFPPLDNPDVRLALCKAIDKETLVGEIWRGFSNPAWGILPKGFPGYTGDKLKGLDPNVYDPEAARQLLSKAGFADGKGFPRFEMWIRQPTPIQLTMCQAIQARWKENLGIEIDLKPADFQAFAEVYQGRGEKAPIYHVAYSLDYYDPATFLNVFVTNGGRHPHKDPAWDAAYAAANATRDPAARFAAIADVEAQLVNSTAYYFLHSPFSIVLWPCNAKGETLQPNKDGYSFWGGGGVGCPHAYEGIYWSDPACRVGVG